MAAIILPQQWVRQPTFPIRVNRNDPLGQYCVGFWYPVGGALYDAIDGSVILPINSATMSQTRDGQALVTSSSAAQAALIPSNNRWKPTAQITVLKGGLKGTSGTYSFSTENGSDGFGSYLGRSYLRVGAAWADQSASVTATTRQTGLTYDGATFWSIRDGVRINSQAITGSVTHSTAGLPLGSRPSNNLPVANEQFVYFAIFNVGFTPQQLKEFYDNPWRVLTPLPQKFYLQGQTTGGSFNPVWSYAANQTLIGGQIAS